VPRDLDRGKGLAPFPFFFSCAMLAASGAVPVTDAEVMTDIFSADYWIVWGVLLALVLFVPVRRIIWMMTVNRAARKRDVDDAEKQRLRRRAGFTAALTCYVFAMLYAYWLFHRAP